MTTQTADNGVELKAFGWLPGNYTNPKCADCGRMFIGAKKCWRCVDCAYAASQNTRPSVSGDTPPSSGALVEALLRDLRGVVDFTRDALSVEERDALRGRIDAALQSAAGWDHRYRRLDKGEIILATDECQQDDGSWRPDAGRCAGSEAPDPAYTSHRLTVLERLWARKEEGVA